METHAPPGAIQVTRRTYEVLRDQYELHPRRGIDIKGKGPMTTYLLVGKRGRAPVGPGRPPLRAVVSDPQESR